MVKLRAILQRAEPELVELDIDVFERGPGDPAGGVWIDCVVVGVKGCEFDTLDLRNVYGVLAGGAVR